MDQLQQLYQATHGNKKVAPIVQRPVDFEQINAFLPDRFTQLTPLLESLFLNLEQDAVDIILIPNITLHVAVDRLTLADETRGKIVHPISLGIEKLQADTIKQITLVGTRHTMQLTLIAQYFERRDIEVLPCNNEDIEALDKIRIEVFREGFSKPTSEEMFDIFSRYSNVVIACTELSILNIGTETDNDSDSDDNSNNVIDLARLQIAKAIALI